MRTTSIFVGIVSYGAIAVLATSLAACDRAPSPAKAREWTAADHDRADESSKGARGAKSESETAPDPTELAWQIQCAGCHGPEGHGDGPKGALVKAPDLTSSTWLATAKNEDVAALIRNGRGQMPKFDLPPPVVAGLVAKVRGLRGH